MIESQVITPETIDEKIAELDTKLQQARENLDHLDLLMIEKKLKIGRMEKEIMEAGTGDRRRSVVRQEIENLKGLLAQAKAEVKRISAKDLKELTSYLNPPKSIQKVLTAVLLLIKKEEFDWKELKATLLHIDFVDEVLNYDIETAEKSLIDRINSSYISDPDWQIDKIKRASKAIGPLAEWLTYQVQYKDAAWELYIDKDGDNLLDEGEEKKAIQAAQERLELDQIQNDRLAFQSTIQKIKDEIERLKNFKFEDDEPLSDGYQRVKPEDFSELDFKKGPAQKITNTSSKLIQTDLEQQQDELKTLSTHSICLQTETEEPIKTRKEAGEIFAIINQQPQTKKKQRNFDIQTHQGFSFNSNQSLQTPAKEKTEEKRRAISPVNSYFKKKSSPSPIISRIDNSISKSETDVSLNQNFVPIPIPIESTAPNVKVQTADSKGSQLTLNQYVNINSTTKVSSSPILLKQTIKAPVIPLKTTTYEKTTVTFPGPGVMVVNPKGLEYHSFVQKNSESNIGTSQTNVPLLKSITTFTSYQSVHPFSGRAHIAPETSVKRIEKSPNPSQSQIKNGIMTVPQSDSTSFKADAHQKSIPGLSPVKVSSYSVPGILSNMKPTHPTKIVPAPNRVAQFSSSTNSVTDFEWRTPQNSNPSQVQFDHQKSKLENSDFRKAVQYESNKSDWGDKLSVSSQKEYSEKSQKEF